MKTANPLLRRGRPATTGTRRYAEYVEIQTLILRDIQKLSGRSIVEISGQLMVGDRYSRSNSPATPESARQWSRWAKGTTRCDETTLPQIVARAKARGWASEEVENDLRYLQEKEKAFERLDMICAKFNKSRAAVLVALKDFRTVCEKVYNEFTSAHTNELPPFWQLFDEDDPELFRWIPIDGETLESLLHRVELATEELKALDLHLPEPYIKDPSGKRPKFRLKFSKKT